VAEGIKYSHFGSKIMQYNNMVDGIFWWDNAWWVWLIKVGMAPLVWLCEIMIVIIFCSEQL